MKRFFTLGAALALAVFAGTAAAFVQPDLLSIVAHALTQHADIGTMLMAVAPAALTGPSVRALKAKKADAHKQATAILAAAEKEGRDLSAEEQTAFDAHKASITGLNAQIERAEFLQAEAAGLDAAGAVVVPAGASISVTDNRAADPARGFKSFGDYLASVRGAAVRPSAMDERLSIGAAATTYANESVGADGGYLVPPQYSSEIMSIIESQDSLLNRCRQIPVTGNEFKFPASEQTAHGTGGVQAYWDSEGDAMTATKPVFQNRSIKLDRLTALCPVTEESLEDSSALGAWVQMEAGTKMAFKVSDAVLNGTGAGMPLGIVAAPGTVSVAKETSQVAATVVAENVLKMWSRMPAANRARAVWIAHSDVDVQLFQLNVKIKNVAGSENVGGMPVYMPPNGLVGGGNSTLLGRPIVTVESCAALGTVGDLIFADLSQYIAITKGAVKADQSMHFYFDQNMRAFRFVFRVGGQPWLSAAMARKNGSSTLSHFVTLATRA